jgi:hypothetical protein
MTNQIFKMKRNYLLLILSFCFSTVFGQDKTIFSDDFADGNKNNWRLIDNDEFTVKIKKHAISFDKKHKNKEKNGCLWYKKEIPNFQSNNDFKMTFDATIISCGDIFNGFDIEWGTLKDTSSKSRIKTSLYQLDFSLSKVRLAKFDDTSIHRWTYYNSSDYLKKDSTEHFRLKLGKKYKYTIEQIGSKLKVSINKIVVYEKDIEPQAGNCIGVQLCLKNNWKMKNLVIKQ